jgi:vitamin B12 transporter
MKYPLLFLFILFQSTAIWSQTPISGSLHDTEGKPVPGANIYFEGTFEGTSSDTTGRFSITTLLEGEATLVISFIGYQPYKQLLTLNGQPVELDIVLEEVRSDLGEVVIAVGTFAAGDESKSAVLSTLDMATGSGGFGDITGVIATLPGTSNAGDEGGLLVRGGERYETATFIDGMQVNDAFTAKMPNVPVRGRFSPMLFRGTVFSTGGYSAEYGQALSSVLLLNSIAMPKKDELFVMAMTSGLYSSATKKWDRTAFSASTGYNNMSFLYTLVNSNIKWQHPPVSISENLVFRQKIGNSGMLKAMGAFGYDNSSMYYTVLNTGGEVLYHLKNYNYLGIVTYKNRIGSKWIIDSGITFGKDDIDVGIRDTAGLAKHKLTTEVKLAFSGPLTEKIRLNAGADLFVKSLAQQYFSSPRDGTLTTAFISPIWALYAEAEIDLTKRFSSRAGARLEALSLAGEGYLSPRLALAYKTSRYSQVSLGYGEFHQQAQDGYVIYNNSLKSEKAAHLIANFQYSRNSRIFRIEAYYKLYDNLVKYDSLYAIDASLYNNEGYGYAQGIDLFIRDSKTLKNGDFWLSYSLMKSERDYQDYSVPMTPLYLSRHNLSLAYKHYFEITDSYVSMGYSYSSGRPYVDPNVSQLVQQRTGPCHNLSFSVFHFTKIFGKFTMLFAQVTNVLGSDNIYGYRFATTPDQWGNYRSEAILPVSKRFFLVGIHFSFTGQTDI